MILEDADLLTEIELNIVRSTDELLAIRSRLRKITGDEMGAKDRKALDATANRVTAMLGLLEDMRAQLTGCFNAAQEARHQEEMAQRRAQANWSEWPY